MSGEVGRIPYQSDEREVQSVNKFPGTIRVFLRMAWDQSDIAPLFPLTCVLPAIITVLAIKPYETQQPNGFDAVSTYAAVAQVRTFAELVQDIERQGWQSWHRAAGAGIRYIPLVTTGWDKEPRKENPVSWELDHEYHQQPFFPSQAKPEEIAPHLRRALEFVDAHPDVCEARAVIIYAWNEHDEGGWLVPTWQNDGGINNRRLEAIRSVLRPESE